MTALRLNEQDVHADCPGCQWGDSVIEHVHDPAEDPAPAECHEHDHPICEPGCPANIGEDHDHPIEQESAR